MTVDNIIRSVDAYFDILHPEAFDVYDAQQELRKISPVFDVANDRESRMELAKALEIERNKRWEDIAWFETGCYDWDICKVWRCKKSSRYYYQFDAGCSCYGPFENEGDTSSLTELSNYISFRDEVLKHFADEPKSEIHEFLATVKRAVLND